jgi:solute carrier family 35, member E1
MDFDALQIARRYIGNAQYVKYNKMASNAIHAHWTIAFTQLVVGIVWSVALWLPGIRKMPILTNDELKKLAPIGLYAACAHGGSVLAMGAPGAGSVTFTQIVKAAEPVFAAVLAFLIPPSEVKSPLAYAMLLMIVSGVGLACVKEGKGIDINMMAFGWASFANLAAALKGKLGKDLSHDLKSKKDNNMTAANFYAVMNILSAAWSLIPVLLTEAATLGAEWKHSTSPYMDKVKNKLMPAKNSPADVSTCSLRPHILTSNLRPHILVPT